MSGQGTRPGAATARLGRGEVWKRLGEPSEQLGSANDPRCHEEQGLTWNEKWIYCGPNTTVPERIVLWHRYDLLGVFRVAADGSLVPEALAAEEPAEE
jgi:hypothetical protein